MTSNQPILGREGTWKPRSCVSCKYLREKEEISRMELALSDPIEWTPLLHASQLTLSLRATTWRNKKLKVPCSWSGATWQIPFPEKFWVEGFIFCTFANHYFKHFYILQQLYLQYDNWSYKKRKNLVKNLNNLEVFLSCCLRLRWNNKANWLIKSFWSTKTRMIPF